MAPPGQGARAAGTRGLEEMDMTNEAMVSVAGYVATDPDLVETKPGSPMLKMRLAWTPRRFDRESNGWVDQPSSFVWVKCWRKVAENAFFSLSKGDAVVVSGTLTVSEYASKDGTRRTSVEIMATSIGHDLSRGITAFRRQRSAGDQAPRDGQSSEPESADSADSASARPQAIDAAGDPGDFDAAADAADLEDRDLDVRDLELLRSRVVTDGFAEEDALASTAPAS
jgi:single-strand DNA-binding protein